MTPSDFPRISRTPPLWLTLIGLFVFACAALTLVTLISALARPHNITLIIDGAAQNIETRAATVADLLEEQQLTLDTADHIMPPLAARLQPQLVVRIERARSVFLDVNGETTPIWTHLRAPTDILALANVRLGAGDRVLIDGVPVSAADLARWSAPPTHISVRHVREITVHDGDQPAVTINTTGDTVGAALHEAGITLYVADHVTPDINAPIDTINAIYITRARPVQIVVDGETRSTRTQGGSVSDALVAAGVGLVGLDYTVPSENTPLRPGMTIRVIRVREVIETETHTIPVETVQQADPDLELDNRRVLQAGQEGIVETRVRVRYENDREIERIIESENVIQAAQNRIIGYGTHVVIRTIDTPEGVREYWRVLRMYATSYHPAAVGGSTTTATGATLRRGIVASNPRVLPYGTQIYVAGYGVGSIQDTGGPHPKRLWVDLGYEDHDYRHWARYVDVYILTPVPERIDYFISFE